MGSSLVHGRASGRWKAPDGMIPGRGPPWPEIAAVPDTTARLPAPLCHIGSARAWNGSGTCPHNSSRVSHLQTCRFLGTFLAWSGDHTVKLNVRNEEIATHGSEAARVRG
jgi:hypothetical protein